ncbi:MAG: ribonuclease T2 family protein [Hyphomicrobiales bacterium]
MAADQRHVSSVSRRAFRALSVIVAVIVQLAVLAPRLNAAGESARTFDYYALSLSWSPTYCASKAGDDDRQQCSPGRRFAFVAHGLWPQYEKGWPENCEADETWVPEETIASMLGIMPSRKLIINEWRKHGTCSGLGIDRYFSKTRELFAKIRIPARYAAPNRDIAVTPKQLVVDFVKTNSGLDYSMISVVCGNRTDTARLSELRICFDRDGDFSPCRENERRQCRANTLVLPRVR